MALDPYERYPISRDPRAEYEEMRRRLYECEKEITHWRDIAQKQIAQSDYTHTELIKYRRYVKVLELALHIAVDNDKKKAEVLDQASKSIEVLKTFEK